MRGIIALAFAFVVLIGIANPAAASGENKCCGDGKVPAVSVQVAACKGTSGKTYTLCRQLAKLPEWWMATNNGNVHVVSGVTLIRNLRKLQPYNTLAGEFRNNIKAYKDQHVHVGPNA